MIRVDAFSGLILHSHIGGRTPVVELVQLSLDAELATIVLGHLEVREASLHRLEAHISKFAMLAVHFIQSRLAITLRQEGRGHAV